VAVDPDLDRVREIRADLDERRPEALIPQVEVVDRDPAVVLGEGELGRLARISIPLAGRPDDLRFLGHPDRGHLRPASRRGLVQVGPHHISVAVSALEPDHRDVVRLGIGADRPPELIPDLGEDRWGSDRHAPVIVQEVDHPARGLQAVDEPGQVDPVQALDIQHHPPVQQFVHRHYMRTR
jgi:hypothetical protein